MTRESALDHRRLESCLTAAIFLGLFLYLWKGIELHLLYWGFGVFATYPIVSLEGGFLREVLSTPGGPFLALAALLAQSYSRSWLGAATITFILGLLLLGIRLLLRAGRAERFRDLAWVPLLLALVVYSNYYENPLPVLLTVVLSVWVAILYGALAQKTPFVRAGLFLTLFSVVYYLAGASALVFAGIACLTEALLHRRFASLIAQMALAVGGAFVLGRFLFGLEVQAIYTAGTPWDPDKGLKFSPLANWLAIVLHAFVPSLLLVAFLGQTLLETEAGTSAQRNRPKKGLRPIRERRQTDPRVWGGLRMFVVGAAAVLCLALSRTHVHYERTLHYYAQHRDWDHVLALANRMRGKHRFTASGVFDINRALAHQGRLGSELCAFPQDSVKTLFLSFDDLPGRIKHAKLIELYLDLGCLNAAERNAYELLAQEGPSPVVLEALVRVHLAKGQYEPAQVVLGALRRCVGGGEYLRRWDRIVADPAQVERDALLQSWRKVKVARDDTSTTLSVAAVKSLVETVPNHRLAFEYLMACHLLRNERTEIISRLPLLGSLGYTRLPRHYAEALLVESLRTGAPLDAQGWTIEPALRQQFGEIRGIVTEARGDDRRVFEALVPKYGDSYMFYSMFNLCGLK
jgi:hypothetical protein